MYYDKIGVHASALKHGVSADDAILAATNFVVDSRLSEDRELRLGFDSSGRLLETVVISIENGPQVVIHAMLARRRYLKILEGKAT